MYSAKLSQEEMKEVFVSNERHRLAILAQVDLDKSTMNIFLANGMIIEVALSFFTASGDGTVPEFEKIAIIDHGQTIQLGKYEASVDAILEERK